MKRSLHRALGLGLGLLVVGCASQEGRETSSAFEVVERASEKSGEDAAAPPAPAPVGMAEAEEAPTAPASERSLVEFEVELATNASRLRALGVEMPARSDEPSPSPAKEDDAGEAQDIKTKDKKGKSDRPGKKRGGAQPKPSAPSSGSAGGMGGGAQPDEAKAVRLAPGGDEVEGTSPCAQICALSHGTCELRGAICELADRHGQEDDYLSACDRAEDDCEIAEEACRACSE